jgi:hypothetical protein
VSVFSVAVIINEPVPEPKVGLTVHQAVAELLTVHALLLITVMRKPE